MLRGYRLLIAAACGLTILIALGTGAYFGSLYAPDHKQYQAVAGDQSRQNDYRGPSQSLPDIAGLPGPVERAIANPRPPSGEDHEKRDLAAQEASALWAFWMVVASFLSVFITTLGTIFLYKQIVLTRKAVKDTGKATGAMKKQNKIAREIGEAQTRAYISVGKVSILLIESYPVIKFNLKNVGITPASSVVVMLNTASSVIWDKNKPDTSEFFEFDLSESSKIGLSPGENKGDVQIFLRPSPEFGDKIEKLITICLSDQYIGFISASYLIKWFDVFGKECDISGNAAFGNFRQEAAQEGIVFIADGVHQTGVYDTPAWFKRRFSEGADT